MTVIVNFIYALYRSRYTQSDIYFEIHVTAAGKNTTSLRAPCPRRVRGYWLRAKEDAWKASQLRQKLGKCHSRCSAALLAGLVAIAVVSIVAVNKIPQT